MEKLLKVRILKFLSKYKIIAESPFDFRQGFSTNQAVSFMTESLHEVLNESKQISAICLDSMKAFNMVNHTILLEQLNHLGVRGTIDNILKSNLNDRKQK